MHDQIEKKSHELRCLNLNIVAKTSSYGEVLDHILLCGWEPDSILLDNDAFICALKYCQHHGIYDSFDLKIEFNATDLDYTVSSKSLMESQIYQLKISFIEKFIDEIKADLLERSELKYSKPAIQPIDDINLRRELRNEYPKEKFKLSESEINREIDNQMRVKEMSDGR